MSGYVLHKYCFLDVPNPPKIKGVTCHKKDATINWFPLGDNRAPILHYTIQYNTSFTPDVWEVAYDSVPAVDMSYNVPMSPWANYTFRVIAWNKIGPSGPSSHSEVCTTQPEVPHKNPDHVIGAGNRSDNLVIKWAVSNLLYTMQMCIKICDFIVDQA